jgi:hypothetical protein
MDEVHKVSNYELFMTISRNTEEVTDRRRQLRIVQFNNLYSSIYNNKRTVSTGNVSCIKQISNSWVNSAEKTERKISLRRSTLRRKVHIGKILNIAYECVKWI